MLLNLVLFVHRHNKSMSIPFTASVMQAEESNRRFFSENRENNMQSEFRKANLNLFRAFFISNITLYCLSQALNWPYISSFLSFLFDEIFRAVWTHIQKCNSN